MRILVVTQIYPNPVEPLRAPFTRLQVTALARLGDEVDVISPIPWTPGARLLPSVRSGRLAPVPRSARIEGIDVRYPRFLHLGRWGHWIAPASYAAALLPDLLRRARPDVIFTPWAFPDGAAAVLAGRALGVPVVVKVIGSDIHVLPRQRAVRAQLRRILPRAGCVVAVSRPLADEVVALGVDPARSVVVRNGIDQERFRVGDRAAARARLGRDPGERLILFVGNLLEAKGLRELCDAFVRIARWHPDLRLVLVGDGPLREEMQRRAARLGDRVTVAGARPHEEIPEWMAACDVLTLPSWSEGTPSVLEEALASGRPVVMTRVGGIPDLVDDPLLGELVPPREPAALAAALERVTGRAHDPAAIARRAAIPTWDESALRLRGVLEEAIRGS